MSKYVEVARTTDFENFLSMSVEIAGRSIAVFKDGAHFFAVEDYCPHAGYTLHDGEVEDGAVVCALHGAKFELRNGHCVGGPPCGSIDTFSVRITEDGSVLVCIE